MSAWALKAALSGAMVIAIAQEGRAPAQVRQFDIPSEDSAKSIAELSRQAGVPIIGPGEPLHHIVTPEIKGTFDVTVALEMMLNGTDLAVSRSVEGIVTISQKKSSCNSEGETMKNKSILAASVSWLAMALTATQCAFAQEGNSDALETVTVTGYRASLATAIQMKRNETAAVDSIVSEDIGKFPDSNLAESMQRIPGVALARGDGGEGREISVRGLGPTFTRVRINGLEGASRTGSSDAYGSSVTGRSFNFNAFPTELFSQLTVRKTPSADTEEGSLGATVDLVAPKPLDQKEDLTIAATVRGVYYELADEVTPRASLLVAKKFDGDRFGILGSIAFQKPHTREVGWAAANILSADSNGLFCSPAGYSPLYPAVNAAKGTDANNCSTNNPRTSTVAAYETIYNARRSNALTTPGSGAYMPRVPRYLNSEQEESRLGGSMTFQFRPDDATDISLDLLYSRYDVTRNDKFIEGVSFARSASNNGQPMTSVRTIELSPLGSLRYGVFDGVDVRSEGLYDKFSSTLKQANLNLKHSFNNRITATALIGMNEAMYRDSNRMQYQMDAIDADNVIIDERGSIPTMSFGIDVSDVNNFKYAPGAADGTVYGGFTLQNRPMNYFSKVFLAQSDVDWAVIDNLALRAGGQFRRTDYTTLGTNFYTADTVTKALPAGTTLADITEHVTGLDKLWGHGAPADWVSLNPEKFIDAFDLDQARTCGVSCGAGKARVLEEVSSAYLMGKFDLTDLVGFGLRGDAGVRYVHTKQSSSGYITVANASTPTGVAGQLASVTRGYDDWLPSANIVVEPMDDVLVRMSAARALARAELGLLMPTSGVNAIIRTGSINNPYLDPVRATTYDVGVEWYFRPGSLLSAAFFYKDIESYIQNVSSLVPFNTLGLPDALLTGSNTLPTENFDISRPVNTPGGALRGIEINAQVPFNFLPGFWSDFGMLANYTHVTSKINYVLSSANGVATATTTADMINLSRNTASATVYYEDDRFSVRGTFNYRDPFIRQLPGNAGSDSYDTRASMFVDASASYAITDKIKFILEGQNLTDKNIGLYIDRTRKDVQQITSVGRVISVGVNVQF